MIRHHALSEVGRQKLRHLATHALLYGFDFDGTLAPLSPDRHGVRLPRSTQEWLSELSRRVPCAIVSGRALDDVRGRVKGAVRHLIGNHGLEGPLTTASELRQAEETCRGWIAALHGGALSGLTVSGVEVEDKRYTVTLHYRRAQDPAHVRPALTALLDSLAPRPRLTFGPACVNALPPTHGGKGAAAVKLMAGLGLRGLFYIGDDDADEEVFALPEGLVMGIRVGHHGDSRAPFYLDHQGEVEDVIRFLVHRLDRTPEAREKAEPTGATS